METGIFLRNWPVLLGLMVILLLSISLFFISKEKTTTRGFVWSGIFISSFVWLYKYAATIGFIILSILYFFSNKKEFHESEQLYEQVYNEYQLTILHPKKNTILIENLQHSLSEDSLLLLAKKIAYTAKKNMSKYDRSDSIEIIVNIPDTTSSENDIRKWVHTIYFNKRDLQQ